MKKQLSLFLTIFLFLTIGIHFSAWVDHPLEHLFLLSHADAYGLGVIHPIIFSFIGYLIISFILWIVHFIWRFLSKRKF